MAEIQWKIGVQCIHHLDAVLRLYRLWHPGFLHALQLSESINSHIRRLSSAHSENEFFSFPADFVAGPRARSVSITFLQQRPVNNLCRHCISGSGTQESVRQTRERTDRQTSWSQYFATFPGQSEQCCYSGVLVLQKWSWLGLQHCSFTTSSFNGWRSFSCMSQGPTVSLLLVWLWLLSCLVDMVPVLQRWSCLHHWQ